MIKKEKECWLEADVWREGTKKCENCECIICEDGQWKDYKDEIVCAEA